MSDNPLQSLRDAMVFDVRDWSEDKRDAWLYAIVVGWGDALMDVAQRHGWDERTRNRLRLLHMKYSRMTTGGDGDDC